MFVLRDERGILKAKLTPRVVRDIISDVMNVGLGIINGNPVYVIRTDMKLSIPFGDLYLWNGDYLREEDL